jgi:DnaB-like helicase N terminal domain/AAA domain/Homeodomain-like domain
MPALQLRTNERALNMGHQPEFRCRSVPHNLEAEQALLGAILINNEAHDRVSDFLEPNHFYDPLHQQIYETTAKLIASGKQATPITLKTFFETAEPIDATLTVPQYLGRLATNAVTIINARDYAQTIYDLAARRHLILIGEDMVNAAYESPVDFDPRAQIAEAGRRLDDLARVTQVIKGRLLPVSLEELLKRQFPPRKFILDELLQQSGIAMVYAWRGLGKTWFALGLGCAAATGGNFLKWKADRPHNVMHVCGEMVATDLRDRLVRIVAGSCSLALSQNGYRVLSADLHENGLPDLALPEGQAALERVLNDTELLILDNVSTLFRAGIENGAESWLPVQNWLLKLRRQGRAVVIIHHAGKGDQQRGTSRREDILDLTLHLRAPKDYDPTDDARFEVHFEKGRGLTGKSKEPFEVKLETREGKAIWTTCKLGESGRNAEIGELSAEGKSVRAIATQLGMSKSAVQRAIQRSKAG